MNQSEDLDPDMKFQRYAHDIRFGAQKEHYYTGPQGDMSPEKEYIARLDRKKMRKLLEDPTCSL